MKKNPTHVRQGMKGRHATQPGDICAWHLKGAEEGRGQLQLEAAFPPRPRCLPLLVQVGQGPTPRRESGAQVEMSGHTGNMLTAEIPPQAPGACGSHL